MEKMQLALIEDTLLHRCYRVPHLQILNHRNPKRNVCDPWYTTSRMHMELQGTRKTKTLSASLVTREGVRLARRRVQRRWF